MCPKLAQIDGRERERLEQRFSFALGRPMFSSYKGDAKIKQLHRPGEP